VKAISGHNNASGRRLVTERCAGYRVFRLPGADAEQLCRTLLPDPDRIFWQGDRVDSGRKGNPRDLARIVVDGRSYFVKRYDSRNWQYRVKNMLRFSRARRCMRAGQALLESGVLTPRPLLCLDRRTWRLLGPSYLVCPFLEDAVSLLDLWPDLDAARREELLGLAGRMFGALHGRGIVHGDTNWRNILVRNAGQGSEFWLVDLDGTRFYRRLPFARAERDIGHFLRDLQRCGEGDQVAGLFRHHWRSALRSRDGADNPQPLFPGASTQ
jgi:tRNA A-37 threonylcarbamoyl transferase component Bud32